MQCDCKICPHCGGKMLYENSSYNVITECGDVTFRCFLCGATFTHPIHKNMGKVTKEKDVFNMQVTYNGFTGELVKLERRIVPGDFVRDIKAAIVYDLSIYNSEKHVTHSFVGVKLEDVKFMGGVVSFG